MTATATAHKAHIPGEPGIWMLIVGDMTLFSLLFGLFLHYRSGDPALFTASQAQLDQGLGLLNTMLMLTSSWAVATAVQAARRGDRTVLRNGLRGAIACGLAFLGVKVVEYGDKIGAGLTMWSNDFFMLYFTYTGIHMIHVVLGLGVLGGLLVHCRDGALAGTRLRTLESCASFWHLVDLIWVVLFALLYLAGQS